MTGKVGVLATCMPECPRSEYPVITNSTEEDQWGMENVEFCSSVARVPTAYMSRYLGMY